MLGKNQLNYFRELAKMLKKATIHLRLFDESHFSDTCIL